MDDKRQKIQVGLALVGEATGEARRLAGRGTESPTAKHGIESLAEGQLMEQVCERDKGSAGVDRMTVAELPGYLKEHWPAIRARLLAGQYQPQPVRRVEIDKPGGMGKRKLGIPMMVSQSTPLS